MLKEFKQFAMKGNVMDLAIGVVIGAAFQKIVSSLVEDYYALYFHDYWKNRFFQYDVYSWRCFY